MNLDVKKKRPRRSLELLTHELDRSLDEIQNMEQNINSKKSEIVRLERLLGSARSEHSVLEADVDLLKSSGGEENEKK